MKRPQFKLRDLLLGTTLIGVGLGCLQWLMTAEETVSVYQVPGIILAIPMITAGLAAPFHRVRLGAYVGFIGQLIVVIGILVFNFGWNEVFDDVLSSWPNRVVAVLTIFVNSVAILSIVRKIAMARSAKPSQES